MIHKTSIIEGDVILGKDVKIGPFSYINGNIDIGDDTEIGPYVQIEGNVKIGKGNTIYHSAYIGAPPQDISYKGDESFVEIGDNNIIREFIQIHRGSKADSVTRLGSNCLLMGGAHLAHNINVGNHVTIANYSVLAGYVEIDDYCFISGLCGFHQFVNIGKYCMIGGCSRINKDCPPFMIISGNPPKVAGINSVGLKRMDFSLERRNQIKMAYKTIYKSGKNVSQAIAQLKDSPHTNDINELIKFIESSERGIIK